MIQAVDHIGIAVRDIEASINFYKTMFQIDSMHREQVEQFGVDIASFSLNGVRIELTAPLHADTPIGKFLEKRGEGIHHIAFRTDTIGEDLHRLSENNIQLINTEPQHGAHDMLVAFLHPASTGGVLMELCSEKH